MAESNDDGHYGPSRSGATVVPPRQTLTQPGQGDIATLGGPPTQMGSLGPGAADTLAGEGAFGDASTLASSSEPEPGPAASLQPGTKIASFVIERTLGRGAMGVVLLARDPELGRPVAIKLVSGRASEEGQQRLLREAQATARLAHPNVVAVHQVGTWSGQVFIVMEFVDGGTLRQWIGEQPRTPAQVLEAFAQAGRGLAAAHDAGLVHRDFKPDNVLVGRDGRVRVSDFGLVGVSGASERTTTTSSESGESSLDVALTRTGALLGTPAYMAPEQFEGARVDARADQFAFAVALFEALYGLRPFAGDTPANLLYAVSHGEIASPPHQRVSASVHGAIVRALAASPDARHDSMTALLAAIAEPGAASSNKPNAAIFGAIASVVLVGGGVALAVTQPWKSDAVTSDGDVAAALPDCENHRAALDELWNETRREQLRDLFASARGDGLLAAGERVERELNRFTEHWIQERVEACVAAQVDKTQSEEELKLRLACLQERRTALAVLLELIGQSSGDLLLGSVGAVGRLAPIDICSDLGALRSLPAPPDDPEFDEAHAALRRATLQSTILLGAGKYLEALAAAESALEQATALDHSPEVARAHLMVAEANLQLTRPPPAAEAAAKAIELAAAAREHDVEADAWIAQLAATYGLSKYDEATAMVASVDAAVARAGRPERIGRVFFHKANLAYLTGELERGVQMANAAIETFADLPDTSAVEGRAYVVRAAIRAAQGDLPAAHADYAKARAVYTKVIGPAHADQGAIHAGEGMAYANAGDNDKAVEHFRIAAQLYLRMDETHFNGISMLLMLGYAHDARGDVDAAEEALLHAMDVAARSAIDLRATVYPARQRLAQIAWQRGRWAVAQERYDGLRALAVDIYGETAGEVARHDIQLAILRQSQGDFEGSLALVESAVKRYAALPSGSAVPQREALALLGNTFSMLGRCAQAKTAFAEAETIAMRFAVAPDLVSAQRYVGGARCRIAEGRLGEAGEDLERAGTLIAAQAQPGPMLPYLTMTRAELALAQGDHERAEEVGRQAATQYGALGPPFAVFAKQAQSFVDALPGATSQGL